MEQTKTKVIVVALDNYKVNYFKKKITKKGYEVKDVVRFNEDVQIIQVNCPEANVYKLGLLIKSLEAIFKRRN